VYVAGRLQTRQWEDQEGVKHSRVELVADKVLFLGRRDDRGKENMDTIESFEDMELSEL
jgi:single-strand DNA-binding protein